eukprot:CAMPEP_0115589820 /NCGR_PEP_ID=MMETSP0272-20121206/9445_1 /TAXON_ID=71861 /ORGANISM="Scrippsiella trochoidea, Strain CCMP3099" /LENGTH=98 /DNA_ID=CAMNT_0003024995 /DNA_START=30 /DNA_END=324 /DNA_ORIENTATION=-
MAPVSAAPAVEPTAVGPTEAVLARAPAAEGSFPAWSPAVPPASVTSAAGSAVPAAEGTLPVWSLAVAAASASDAGAAAVLVAARPPQKAPCPPDHQLW